MSKKRNIGEWLVKHGHAKNGKQTNIYSVWASMKTRCNNSNNKDYGGRGIKVCERWDKFENFLTDMGECPKGFMLDRIDNNGNYEPSNCRWTDAKTSQRNSRWIKLSMEKAKEIRKLHSWGFKQYEIAKHFNVSPRMICHVVNNDNWS